MTARRAPRRENTVARRGLMIVLSSPSGAGKTTLSRKLLEAEPVVELSVSVTTRKQRPGEIDGRDYHFIDAARFDAMMGSGELLEWAQVFGHRYGTPRAPVAAALAGGRDVLFDIDWQGTQQLREKADRDLVSIFVLPPSMRDLEKRLCQRDGRLGRAMAIKVIVAELAHLLVGDPGEPLGAEAQRGAPQPCHRLDVVAAGIVEHPAALAARNDQRTFLLVPAKVGLHVHEACDVARLDRARNIGHAASSDAAAFSNASASAMP